IDLFFELDIDCIIGYDNVRKLRNKIEAKTGKQPIPVWHRSRGKDDFIAICKDYKYVAVGGIAIKDIKPSEHKYLNFLCDIAHENGAKIHGLGFMKRDFKKYRFDSVDTTAWVYGNRCGFVYKFNGEEMVRIKKPEGTKLIAREVRVHNVWEWVKYSEYLEEVTGTVVYLAGHAQDVLCY
ncbi:MAG TPA: hypothetical protein PLV01_06660, partial [Candidatus Kapabacteria bacterium]|nr:hypothetical protein [Candidatus Kapabacteria bacterium]